MSDAKHVDDILLSSVDVIVYFHGNEHHRCTKISRTLQEQFSTSFALDVFVAQYNHI